MVRFTTTLLEKMAHPQLEKFGFPNPPKIVIRTAESSDSDAIMRLLQTAMHLHLHADWCMPLDWLGTPSCVVYEQDGTLKGFLAVTQDPPPVAWIRVAAVDKLDPERVLRDMMAVVADELQQVGCEKIAALAAKAWVDDTLPLLGFHVAKTLETLRLDGVEPRNPKPDRRMPSPRITIRPVAEADYEQLTQVDRAAFSDPIWWHSAEQFRRGKQYAICFDVAELDGKLVGFQYSTGGRSNEAHLVRIAVMPHLHGEGVGSAMLAAALQHYADQKLQRVTLNTQIDNVTARRLYTSFGFEATGTKYFIWSKKLA